MAIKLICDRCAAEINPKNTVTFGVWDIPYCPHCKRQLGLMVKEQKAEKCPMCGKTLDWRDNNG